MWLSLAWTSCPLARVACLVDPNMLCRSGKNETWRFVARRQWRGRHLSQLTFFLSPPCGLYIRTARSLDTGYAPSCRWLMKDTRLLKTSPQSSHMHLTSGLLSPSSASSSSSISPAVSSTREAFAAADRRTSSSALPSPSDVEMLLAVLGGEGASSKGSDAAPPPAAVRLPASMACGAEAESRSRPPCESAEALLRALALRWPEPIARLPRGLRPRRRPGADLSGWLMENALDGGGAWGTPSRAEACASAATCAAMADRRSSRTSRIARGSRGMLWTMMQLGQMRVPPSGDE